MSDRRFRLLVFDWDGTLMDSVASIVDCARVTLAELGLPAVPRSTLRATVGLGLRDTLEVLSPGAEEELAGRIVTVYRKHWLAGYRDRPVLFRGAAEALDELGAAGYLLAVATGKSRAGLERDLDSTGVRHRFVATRTVDEAPGKPRPEMLVGLLDELGVGPAEALMVGDSRWDLEMAANAGAPALAVTSGSLERDELEILRPLACLDGVAELPAWLRQGRADG